ncbi:MAG: aldehyde dehydrogenase family protein, partial [Raineya sp.]|nr:aldehyde dehydrogenase family protein [Raineya sp.]
MIEILNYVGGKLQKSISGEFLPNVEPATGKIFAQLPRSNEKDVAIAVTFAQQAQETWKNLGAEGRAKIMLKIADLIEQNAEMLAQAESRDNGKPVWLARQMDIPRASQNMRFYATACLHWANESYQQVGSLNY